MNCEAPSTGPLGISLLWYLVVGNDRHLSGQCPEASSSRKPGKRRYRQIQERRRPWAGLTGTRHRPSTSGFVQPEGHTLGQDAVSGLGSPFWPPK